MHSKPVSTSVALRARPGRPMIGSDGHRDNFFRGEAVESAANEALE
jgi:hypothetical protein